jgi:hypothetical protein
MPDVLNALVAFVAEHQRCGDLDGGRDDGKVWIACSCGAQIVQPASPTSGADTMSPATGGRRTKTAPAVAYHARTAASSTRYYREPPGHWREWRHEEPTRWEHDYGHEWDRHREGGVARSGTGKSMGMTVGVRTNERRGARVGVSRRPTPPRASWIVRCSCGWVGQSPSAKAGDALARHHVQRHPSAALQHVISIQRQSVPRGST